MSATSATLGGRILAESLMESECVITRVTGTTVDPATGLETPTTATIYTGKCRLRFPYVRPLDIIADGQVLTKERGILWVPVDATGSADVRTDDVVTMTASALDVGSVGLQFTIGGPFTETHATSRRFPVVVTS